MATTHDKETGLRIRKCDCAECFYCDALLAPRHEHDHFPVPASLRGDVTVPACGNCHEWKDRSTLKAWPLDMHGAGLMAILGSVDVADLGDPDSTPVVAVLLAAVGDYSRFWAAWSWEARIYYAKLTVVASVEEYLRRVALARALLTETDDPAQIAAQVGIRDAAARRIAVAAGWIAPQPGEESDEEFDRRAAEIDRGRPARDTPYDPPGDVLW